MPGTTAPTTDLWEAMFTQRAIRYFKPDPVPADVIRKIIEAATQAPSGSNLQPWGFVVIQDAAMRKRIADKLREGFGANPQMKAYVDSGKASADKSTRLMMGGVSNIVEHLDSAPVLIIPCLHSVQSLAPDGLLAGSSIYQAVQNLMLAARGLGLGTLMSTFQQGMLKELSEWLKLPGEGTRPVALIPMGYPAVNFGPLKRKPVEEVLHWETWGATKPS
jgi:nitroreductase